MEKLELRESSLGWTITSCIIWSAWIAVSGGIMVFCITSTEPLPVPYLDYVLFVISLLFFLYSFYELLRSIASYNTKMIISKKELVIKKMGVPEITIPISNIHVFGCACFIHRNTFLYFCTRSQEEIRAFAEKNCEKGNSVFGKAQAEKLRKTEYGNWQLAVGLYVRLIHRKPENVIVFGDGTPERLSLICNYLDKTPVLTGPGLINNQTPWLNR